MNGGKGVWGRQPRQANGIQRSQIKWQLLLFDESDSFPFETSSFYVLFRVMLFILS